jgi:hypothetical protein
VARSRHTGPTVRSDHAAALFTVGEDRVFAFLRVVARSRKRQLWLEVHPEDPCAWAVAYRLVPHEGETVAAEMRVYPSSRSLAHVIDGEPGAWSNESCDVPRGGIGRRQVRDIPVGEHLQLVTRLLAQSDLPDVPPEWRRLLQNLRSQVALEGFDDLGPGAPGTDLGWVLLAKEYAELVQSGRSDAVEVMASRRDIPVATMRDYIYRLRPKSMGYLTAPPRPGRAGGMLTDKALRILAAARNES